MPRPPHDPIADVPRLRAGRALELAARRVLAGSLAGAHRSPFLGSSIDFAEHRPYLAGDDLRALDWKAYARSDRLLVRRYHDERRLPLALLVDRSASMAYGEPAKDGVARLAAAALALLALDQGDEVRVIDGAERKRWTRWLGGGAAPAEACAAIAAPAAPRFDAAATLRRAAEHVGRRSLLVVVGDLLDEPEPLCAAAADAAARGHEVACLQVLDRSELALPADWGRSVLHDPEDVLGEVPCDAAEAKDAYDRAMGEHLAALHAGLGAAGAEHVLLATDVDVARALAEWLARRRRR